MDSNLLLVGCVTRPHGLIGECKIIPESDDPDRLLSLKRVWIGPSADLAKAYEVRAVRRQHTKHGITILMRLFGINSVEEAKEMGRQHVFALDTDLPPLEPGEYFLHDLPGCCLMTEEGEPAGRVADVLETPAGPMLKVMGSRRDGALVPLVPQFIRNVDVESRRIYVRTIEGLLD